MNAPSKDTLKYLRSNTAAYIRLVQGETLETYQKEICDLVDQYERVSIKACHAVGKTYTLGHIVDALLKNNPGAIILTTAPTARQVKDLLWGEIHKAHKKDLPAFQYGNATATELRIDHDWYAKGFSPQKNVSDGPGQGTASNFQGYHGRTMTIIIFDEATGVEPIMWSLAEGMMNTGKVKWICIANPTARNCDFFHTFNNRNWVNYSITCFDSPNLIANQMYNRHDLLKEYDYLIGLDDIGYSNRLKSYARPAPHLIGLDWVMKMLVEWGIDHPLFLSKVLGEFPAEDANSLIPESVVNMSFNRVYEPVDRDVRYIGVDVARMGGDKTVFTEFIGWKQIRVETHSKLETTEVSGCLMEFIKGSPDYGKRECRVAIDAGYNPGVLDILMLSTGQKELNKHNEIYKDMYRTMTDRVTILSFDFGGSDWVKFHYGWKDEAALRDPALEDDRMVQEDRSNYLNFKAKMFDLLARDMRSKVALKDDDKALRESYIEELPSIIILPASDSKMKIESKQDYKTRTGKNSPDKSDSLALANIARYYAVRPMGMLEAMGGS
jgi:hypothetical protein